MTPPPAAPAAARAAFAGTLATLGPLLGLALIVALFAAINGRTFLSPDNFRMILADSVIVAIAALGMTLVIIGGGIDLSTGALVALASVVCARVAAGLTGDSGDIAPSGWALAIAAGLGTGLACGLANGLAVVGLRVVPFIATLGMLSVARGVAKWQADNSPIPVTYEFGGWVQPWVEGTPWQWMLLPPSVWIAVLLAIVFGLTLTRTVYGRHVVALGSSEPTARLCGLRIGRLKISLYALAGLMAGLAGVVQTSRLTQGDPTVAIGLELNVIAAVVIGGASLSGGEGSILGTLSGALIMAVLLNGATLAGWENYVQEILVGAIIVLAVALDQLRTRRRLE